MPPITASNEKDWDAFVLQHGGGFLQSWGWAEFQKALGRTVYRTVLRAPADKAASGEPIAQFLLINHPLPLGLQYLYMPWGPVLRDGAEGAHVHEQLETVTVALRKAMRGDRAFFARVDFPFSRLSESALDAQDLESLGFERVKSMQPADSSVVDLRKDEAALLAAMHSKTRYNTKVAERHGVTVREGAIGDIDLFWTMLGETAERDRFHTHPTEYYKTMIRTLSGKGRPGCAVRLFFAERDGEALAAGLFATFGDRITYLHGASVSSARKYMAPYALHWQVMRGAKAEGFASYDLWGIAPDDSDEHPWAGITRFKQGFGGERVGYLGTWELPDSRIWYTLYRWVRMLRG